MNFVDEAIITVQSGNGGRGCVSFRREKYIPRGGPDGGDGGKGGDVVLRVSSGKRTLYDFRHKKQFKAQNGQQGQGRQKTGRDGEDLVIELPPGTLIWDTETGQIIADLIEAGQTFVAAKGGRGGQGNTRFKSATHRAPRFSQPGEPGQSRTLKLELKLIADIGIIGLPNAGKSTLISAISSANPKIGAYPFTTLTPNLGVVQAGSAQPFIVADIPGLIAGAHEGTGLGIRFLRHIERTGFLIHLIDASRIDLQSPLDDYRIINAELAHYGRGLNEKPQVVVLNKMDLAGTTESARAFESTVGDKSVLLISAVTGAGVDRLISHISHLISQRVSKRGPQKVLIGTATTSESDDGQQDDML
ncbi:MAG: GTPase ObgE [Desulfobacterales bacterium]